MSIIKERQSVRDGYLKDIPEDIQNKIYAASKVIIEILNSKIDDEHYEDLTKSNWAMSCLDEFKTPPSAKGEVGSVRAYKVGKQYKCMIQVTGHFTNHQYGWIEELLHEIIADTHQDAKPEIRKKFDVTLDNEGTKGNPFEGFDIYLPNKQAKLVWDIFEGRKTKLIKESYYYGIPEDLIDYYENYRDHMTYDQYFEEKSRGKLKYAYRRCVDANTGHDLKVVYSLDDLTVTNMGGTRDITDTNPNHHRNLEKDIRKTGHTDFESKGQRVLAIYDTITGKRLKEADTLPVFADMKGKVVHLKEGEIDNNPSSKSTFWDKNYNDTTVDEARTALFDRQQYNLPPDKRIGRGTKLRGMRPNIHTWRLNTIKDVKWTLDHFEPGKYDKYIDDSRDSIASYERYLAKIKGDKGGGLFDEKDLHQFIMDEKYNIFKCKTIKDYCTSHKSPYTMDNAKELMNLLNKHRDNRNDPKFSSITKMESANNNPEYNVDMTDSQVKRTLRTLSQDIINKTAADKNYKINQYTADIYANIITKNLLPKWASGYKKLSITLDSYQSFFTLEFKIPTMSQDFVSRFINGREPMNAFLHRVPEIKIKMSPRIFHTMKDPDDAFKFFRAAVRYYDQKVERYSKQLMNEAFKLSSQLKHLISTTNLSGLITCPIQLLFVFDDVHMSNDKTFLLTDEDIKAVNGFMKGIYTKYAAPEKEKKKIVEDVKALVKELRESCDTSDNMSALSYLPEAVDQYLTGGFDKEIDRITNRFINEQVDVYEMNHADPDLKYVREKFGVKKLKRIPTDLVAYISIETEAIETPNDKMMIASYCLSKLEIVEWYIELLEVGSEKYVVPHNMPYLVNVRTQLLKCYDKIMRTPTRSNKNRPIISVNYPDGYEG